MPFGSTTIWPQQWKLIMHKLTGWKKSICANFITPLGTTVQWPGSLECFTSSFPAELPDVKRVLHTLWKRHLRGKQHESSHTKIVDILGSTTWRYNIMFFLPSKDVRSNFLPFLIMVRVHGHICACLTVLCVWASFGYSGHSFDTHFKGNRWNIWGTWRISEARALIGQICIMQVWHKNILLVLIQTEMWNCYRNENEASSGGKQVGW